MKNNNVRKKKNLRLKPFLFLFVLIIISLLIYNFNFSNTNSDLNKVFSNNSKNYTYSDTSSYLLTLVNKNTKLPNDYEPNLIKFKNIKISKDAKDDLEEMMMSAKKDNVNLFVNTSYRSISEQNDIYSKRIKKYIKNGLSKQEAENKTNQEVQKPGFSEHHTGLALDFSKEGDYDYNELIWKWLSKNAHKYGFILRYPRDKVNITLISFEPWHYRYVGKDNAKIMYDENLTLEEFLSGNGKLP